MSTTIRLPVLQDRLLSSGGSAEIERAGSKRFNRFEQQCWTTLVSFQCYDFTRISLLWQRQCVRWNPRFGTERGEPCQPPGLCRLLWFVELKCVFDLFCLVSVYLVLEHLIDCILFLPHAHFPNTSMHECTCLSVFSFHASSLHSFFEQLSHRCWISWNAIPSSQEKQVKLSMIYTTTLLHASAAWLIPWWHLFLQFLWGECLQSCRKIGGRESSSLTGQSPQWQKMNLYGYVHHSSGFAWSVHGAWLTTREHKPSVKEEEGTEGCIWRMYRVTCKIFKHILLVLLHWTIIGCLSLRVRLWKYNWLSCWKAMHLWRMSRRPRRRVLCAHKNTLGWFK